MQRVASPKNVRRPISLIGVANAPYPMKGVGPFTHTNPLDRPPAIFGGKNTLHFGGKFAPYLLLPIIPKSA